MLLIVTNKTDLACDFLILRLRERGIPFARLNTEDYGTCFEVEISIGTTTGFRISFQNGRCLTASDISAVYFRQPKLPVLPDDIASSDRSFVRREMKETLRSLWRVIDDEKWLNHPRNLWLASNKIEQLTIAKKLSFCVLETCVTSSKETLAQFFALHDGQIICKAVKHGFSHADNVVTLASTKRVEAQFIENFEEFAKVSMIYQREIIKAYDIRVIVVGSSVFATAIHSQEYPETEVDWRVWDVSSFDLHHEAITLPPEIEEACRQMTSLYSLRYSAIDLILGDDGRFYFLELNANGQWAWIEKKADYPIRDAIISNLNVKSAAYA